jgi:hypothetical protein
MTKVKNLLKNIEAVPSKRLYLSIIADYDLKLGLCELIDNAIDNWTHNERKQNVKVSIELDYERQIIQVTDNSGGIKESEIDLIVSPGQTRSNPGVEAIGYFGVGSKRAVFAMAQEIKIRTRFKAEATLLIELNDSWIAEEGWGIDVYEVDKIPEGSTSIELTRLRKPIKQEEEQLLLNQLGAIYAKFLKLGGFELEINETPITAIEFESWSYPPGFGPKLWEGTVDFKDKGKIEVDILGGLTRSGDPSGDEYGVYIYCNDRLVLRASKAPEVGWRIPGIGNPHPSKGLARVLVYLTGPTQLMPWNSSKSQIDFKHKTFTEIADHIAKILKHYGTLSKKFSSERWTETVFPYTEGEVKKETVKNFSSSAKIYLPIIPRGERKKKYPDLIKSLNKELSKTKPWVVGLYEAIIAVDEIRKLKLQQNNRLCLLIMDSTLEIAFKEFLVYETIPPLSERTISAYNRPDLQREVAARSTISAALWRTIDYYYHKRCDLVHKRASTQISNDELATYRETVELVLTGLFGISFS